MKTFLQLQEEVLRYFDLAGEATEQPDESDAEMAKAALNQANQNRVSEDKWKFMQSGVYTLTLSAPTQSYILPHTNFGRFHFLWSETYKKFIVSAPMRHVPHSDVDFNDSLNGSNMYYDFDGFSPVKVQPSVADELALTSSLSETNGPTLYVEGEDSDGAAISETLSVNGTSTQQFAKVTYVAKIGVWLGTLTLATQGGTTLLQLTVSEFGRQYPVIKFYNIPTANEVFQYRYFRAPRVMARDYDIPDLPFPHSNLLVWDALLMLATYNELDSESVNLWRANQIECLNNLYLLKLEGDTIAGYGEYLNGEFVRWP